MKTWITVQLPGADLTPDFFRRPPGVCARELIGCIFRWNGCEGRIVETESYEEFDDPACHTWNRPGARRFIAGHDAGAAYVYLNYGVHWLFNVLTKSQEGNGFVLFRALEPTVGLDKMRQRRGVSDEKGLCSGPGKLTKALEINGNHHGLNFLEGRSTGIRRGGQVEIITGRRIGISRAEERPWRYGMAASNCLSRKF
ncbi:DNA-3-methyladenine glycosylase [Luteolibacter sp. SL250]|uniref:DNA-3-methyladenine glycosylase n=1 Tax=Luteolibacter sp. SL250 TaxID=2995170 RepID=UPI00226D8BEA|nr:DNA-3-methyladenine glycosylase [Luteolibacter sp. SL250]WAC21198.1 DNA-3-methyladenine glycosylase [Luteolibacter sp. SL250]